MPRSRLRSGIEAMELARAHHPDLILMDIQLPEVSRSRSDQMAEGRTTTSRISPSSPSPPSP